MKREDNRTNRGMNILHQTIFDGFHINNGEVYNT